MFAEGFGGAFDEGHGHGCSEGMATNEAGDATPVATIGRGEGARGRSGGRGGQRTRRPVGRDATAALLI